MNFKKSLLIFLFFFSQTAFCSEQIPQYCESDEEVSESSPSSSSPSLSQSPSSSENNFETSPIAPKTEDLQREIAALKKTNNSIVVTSGIIFFVGTLFFTHKSNNFRAANETQAQQLKNLEQKIQEKEKIINAFEIKQKDFERGLDDGFSRCSRPHLLKQYPPYFNGKLIGEDECQYFKRNAKKRHENTSCKKPQQKKWRIQQPSSNKCRKK